MSTYQSSTESFHEFNSAAELLDFLKETDLLLSVNLNQCKYMLSNLAEKSMFLGSNGHQKLSVAFSENGERTNVSDMIIDDAIDLACDVAFEKILQADKEMKNANSFKEKIDAIKKSARAVKEEAALDMLFTQTIYFKKPILEKLHQKTKEKIEYPFETPKPEVTKPATKRVVRRGTSR